MLFSLFSDNSEQRELKFFHDHTFLKLSSRECECVWTMIRLKRKTFMRTMWKFFCQLLVEIGLQLNDTHKRMIFNYFFTKLTFFGQSDDMKIHSIWWWKAFVKLALKRLLESSAIYMNEHGKVMNWNIQKERKGRKSIESAEWEVWEKTWNSVNIFCTFFSYVWLHQKQPTWIEIFYNTKSLPLEYILLNRN